MKLPVLVAILIYYTFIGLFFVSMSDTFSGYTSSENLSGISETYAEGEATIFDAIGDFFLFMTFGVGLPESTPSWFQTIFTAWSVMMTLITAGFIYQAVRSGT